MVFGFEAILPADVTFWAPRVKNYNEENSDQARFAELDNLVEERLVSSVWMAKYLDSMQRYYNHNVNDRCWHILVLSLEWINLSYAMTLEVCGGINQVHKRILKYMQVHR
jgi:hypothetical protein